MGSVTDGVLSETILEALRIRDRMRADGASVEECDAALEKTLRASWPQTREWKHLCGECRDYGLIIRGCPGDKPFCGRRKVHLPHEYGEPCFCAAGGRFKPKPKSGEDFTEATKVRQPTRFGR